MGLSAASIVVLCSFAIQASFFGTDFFFISFGKISTHVLEYVLLYLTTRVCYAVIQAAAYLLYSLLGWLSDVYFTRYKVIRLSFIVVFLVAAECVIVAVAIFNTNLVKTTLSFDILITLILLGFFLAKSGTV